MSRPSCPELFLSSSNLSLVAHPNHCIPHFSPAPLVDILLYSAPARILQPTMVSCRRCRVRMIAGQITAGGDVRAAQAGKKGSRAEHLHRGCPCRPGLAAEAVGSVAGAGLRLVCPRCLLAAVSGTRCLLVVGAGPCRRAGCRCWPRRPESARVGPPSRLGVDKGGYVSKKLKK